MSRHQLRDGGVYDNLGIESLYKPDKNLVGDLTYLIVSNAAGPQGMFERKGNFSGANLKRLLDIAMAQVGALRTRDLFSNVMSEKKGIFFQIGNSAEKIVEESTIPADTKKQLIKECMSASEAEFVKNYATTLSSPTEKDYKLILQHGYENAKCTYICFGNTDL